MVALAGLAFAPARPAGPSPVAADQPIGVVIVLPGPLPGNVLVADHIRSRLQSAMRQPIDFHTEFIEEVRFPGRADLFADVPIVFTGVRPTDVTAAVGLPAGVTGVWRPLPVADTVDAALTLQPDTERVVVISGTSHSERAFLQDVRTGLTVYEKRLQVSHLTDRPMRDVLASVSTLPPRTVVLYQMLQRDSEDNTFVPHQALAMISKASSVPVWGMFEPYVGHGAVGGRVISFTDLGTRTGRLGAEILTAGPGAPLPPPREAPGVYRFDWRELQRWRLDERRLPPGSTVLHRGKTTWEEYGWLIGITVLSGGASS
ncbi:MAG: ABC transporter substrate-binding protein [Candidatus Rokuibacteriota bacterium]